MARQQKQPTWSMHWRYTTRLSESVVSTPMDKTSKAKCEIEVICANAVERAHTKSVAQGHVGTVHFVVAMEKITNPWYQMLQNC